MFHVGDGLKVTLNLTDLTQVTLSLEWNLWLLKQSQEASLLNNLHNHLLDDLYFFLLRVFLVLKLLSNESFLVQEPSSHQGRVDPTRQNIFSKVTVVEQIK